MDLTVFEYIKEIPVVIDNTVWYELAVRSYNLGLTLFWFIILIWIFDLLFKNLSRLYKGGAK